MELVTNSTIVNIPTKLFFSVSIAKIWTGTNFGSSRIAIDHLLKFYSCRLIYNLSRKLAEFSVMKSSGTDEINN